MKGCFHLSACPYRNADMGEKKMSSHVSALEGHLLGVTVQSGVNEMDPVGAELWLLGITGS